MRLNDPRQDAPVTLYAGDFSLRAITVEDAQRDYDAVMDSREDLRKWEQSDWPSDQFTVEENLVDIADMAERTAEGTAHDFTVVNAAGDTSLGCVYVFPPTAGFLTRATITPLVELDVSQLDAIVYFWARTQQARAGLTETLLKVLREWFANEWKLEHVVFAVSTPFAHQMEVFAASDLIPLFELRESDKAEPYLLFGAAP